MYTCFISPVLAQPLTLKSIKIKANKHNTEEVEGLFDAAPVSIRTVPSGYFVRDWPIRGPAPHQAQRIRVQLLACSFGMYFTTK